MVNLPEDKWTGVAFFLDGSHLMTCHDAKGVPAKGDFVYIRKTVHGHSQRYRVSRVDWALVKQTTETVGMRADLAAVNMYAEIQLEVADDD